MNFIFFCIKTNTHTLTDIQMCSYCLFVFSIEKYLRLSLKSRVNPNLVKIPSSKNFLKNRDLIKGKNIINKQKLISKVTTSGVPRILFLFGGEGG